MQHTNNKLFTLLCEQTEITVKKSVKVNKTMSYFKVNIFKLKLSD